MEKPDFRSLFEQSPPPCLVLRPDPHLTVLAANDGYLALTGRSRTDIIGRDLFDAFPAPHQRLTANGAADLRSSLQRAAHDRARNVVGVQTLTLQQNDGAIVERYWISVISPIVEPDGNLAALLHRVEDVTTLVLAHPPTALSPGPSRRGEASERSVQEMNEDNHRLREAMKQLERRETELAQLNESLITADKAKTAFIGNIAHEFRNPVQLILGSLEDGPADSASEAAVQLDMRDLAHRNALRLHKLVTSLQDFSLLDAGRALPTYHPVDLGAFTAEVASQFEAACAHAGLTLVRDCPSLDQTTFVDPDMWEKVVFNLLSNAFKFTFKGTIRVAVRQDEGCAELIVQDTGIGIAPSDLEHVFERFYRAKGPPGRSIEGSGIGLALTRDLVALHGGVIAAASVLGEGSEFRVRIPSGCAHLPPDRISPAPAVAPTPAGAKAYVAEVLSWEGRHDDAANAQRGAPNAATGPPRPVGQPRPRILVVEDNHDVRCYIVRLLERAEYDVLAVADGKAALAASRGQPAPDLLLIDIMMPELDGIGLLRALRSDPNTESLLAILVSVRAGQNARIEGLNAGADDFIVKPFSSAELLARIAATIQLAKVRRDATIREAALNAQIQLEKARFQLLHSSRVSEMGTMIATLAHELTQPISAVNTYVATCIDLLRLDTPAARVTALRGLVAAEAQATRAAEIVGRLLVYISKKETPWQACDLNSLTWEAGRLALPGPQRGGLELAWGLAEHLPAVLGDPVQIQQVIVNLVRNAYEAMIEDQSLARRLLSISTWADQDGNVVVSIADTGRGIDPSVANTLWEPFSGGRPTGIGLGLSICHCIITTHGGQIWAESVPAGGTVFRFRLPPLGRVDDAAG